MWIFRVFASVILMCERKAASDVGLSWWCVFTELNNHNEDTWIRKPDRYIGWNIKILRFYEPVLQPRTNLIWNSYSNTFEGNVLNCQRRNLKCICFNGKLHQICPFIILMFLEKFEPWSCFSPVRNDIKIQIFHWYLYPTVCKRFILSLDKCLSFSQML